MKILLTLILLIPLICRAEPEFNCETLADYYAEYAKPQNAPSKDMLSSGYYMGLVWGFLNGDSRRSYRPPKNITCLLYTSPSPRDATLSRMPSSA